MQKVGASLSPHRWRRYAAKPLSACRLHAGQSRRCASGAAGGARIGQIQYSRQQPSPRAPSSPTSPAGICGIRRPLQRLRDSRHFTDSQALTDSGSRIVPCLTGVDIRHRIPDRYRWRCSARGRRLKRPWKDQGPRFAVEQHQPFLSSDSRGLVGLKIPNPAKPSKGSVGAQGLEPWTR